jgi:hypothetical protein
MPQQRARYGQTAISDTTPTLIVAADLECREGVQVKSLIENTDVIYIGESDLDATSGFPLAPGEGLFIPVDKTLDTYALAGVDTEKLAWVVI